MKRDMDLVRSILLSFNETESGRVSPKRMAFEGYSSEQVLFHVEILVEAGLLDHHVSKPAYRDGTFSMLRFDMGIRPTMAGYDFADSVRDPDVWAKTKRGAEQAGGFTIELLKDLAKGFVKKKIEELTGVKL